MARHPLPALFDIAAIRAGMAGDDIPGRPRRVHLPRRQKPLEPAKVDPILALAIFLAVGGLALVCIITAGISS